MENTTTDLLELIRRAWRLIPSETQIDPAFAEEHTAWHIEASAVLRALEGQRPAPARVVMPEPVTVPKCFKELLRHAHGMTMGTDWNKGTMASHHREPLGEAVVQCQVWLAAPQPAAEPVVSQQMTTDHQPHVEKLNRSAEAQAEQFGAGVSAASRHVVGLVAAYDEAQVSTDPETGAREYPGNGEEWVGQMLELAEELSNLVPPPALMSGAGHHTSEAAPDVTPAAHAGQQEPVADVAGLQAEVDRLRGLLPEMPPRPPYGGGLPRYGLRWNGPQRPLAVPMNDGYWTPWHLAFASSEALVEALEEIVAQYPNPDITHVDYRVNACRHAEHALAAHHAQQEPS
jgi:hypothetical protein